MNVLLVDDDPECLLAVQEELEVMDHRCIATNDPRVALAQFALHDFDLVITDYRMPFMTGSELACKIRTKTPTAKIILLSGYFVTDESPNESLFHAIIGKPVDLQRLKSVLNGL